MAKIAVYIVKKLKNICSTSLSTDYKRPYAIPHVNIKQTVDGNPDATPPFWGARKIAWSMDIKYSKVLCELTASKRHSSKLICFGEHWVLSRSWESHPSLVRKELTNFSAVLKFHRLRSFWRLVMWSRPLHKVYVYLYSPETTVISVPLISTATGPVVVPWTAFIIPMGCDRWFPPLPWNALLMRGALAIWSWLFHASSSIWEWAKVQ